LPLFGHLRQALLEALSVQNASTQLATHLAPESLLYFLNEYGVPVAEVLREVLSGGDPNAVHYTIANALESGIGVWTTNADELVEKAAGIASSHRLVAVARRDTKPLADARLFKLHGTISEPWTLAFQTPDVVNPPVKGWRDCFAEMITGRRLIIAGYAGADPDIRPLLNAAFDRSSVVQWIEIPGSCSVLERRFHHAVVAGKLVITPSANPSMELVAMLEGAGIRGCPSLQSELENVAPPVLDLSGWRLPRANLARGRILEHLGEPHAAVRRYLAAVLSGPHRVEALLRALGVGLYRGTFWTFPLRRLVSLAAVTRLRWRQSFLVTLQSRLLEKEGHYIAALEFALRSYRPHPRDVSRALDVCAPARKAGRVRMAELLARRAVRLAETQSRTPGEEIARALFELTYALRLLGDLAGARAALERYSGCLDLYGGPNWVAWGLCQRGCLAILEGRQGEPLEEDLRSAVTIFTEMGDFHKAAAVRGNLVTAHRFRGALAEAWNELEETRILRESVPRSSAFEDEALAFEEAELSRASGLTARAVSIYRRLATSESRIHRVLGMLGLASLRSGEHDEAVALARQAVRLSRKAGILFGVVRGFVRLRGEGAVDKASALRSIGTMTPFADTRSVEDLFDQASSSTELIFPS
jgi:tetratricopeptide (TPR) repeat protein